ATEYSVVVREPAEVLEDHRLARIGIRSYVEMSGPGAHGVATKGGPAKQWKVGGRVVDGPRVDPTDFALADRLRRLAHRGRPPRPVPAGREHVSLSETGRQQGSERAADDGGGGVTVLGRQVQDEMQERVVAKRQPG